MKKRLEAAMIRPVVGLIDRLPLSWSRRIADALAWLIGDVIGIRRSVVEENLGRVFPGRKGDWRDRIRRECYRFFARSAVEWVKAEELLERSTIRQSGWEHIEQREGEGVIAATGHIGFWELAAAFLARRFGPVHVYADRQANPYSQRLIEHWRSRYNVHGVSGPSGIRRLVKELRNGRPVGLLGDQRPRGPHAFVPFFGSLVRNTRILSFLARKTGAAVVPAAVLREGPETLRVRIDPPLPASLVEVTKDNRNELLRQYNRWVEQRVRETPAQYFWLHRRWKNARSLPDERTSPGSGPRTPRPDRAKPGESGRVE